jgi:hypothetical protein
MRKRSGRVRFNPLSPGSLTAGFVQCIRCACYVAERTLVLLTGAHRPVCATCAANLTTNKGFTRACSR